ncbi:MAG: hypothetical protein QW587_10500 [Candidatus Bathyarchaeia archaeon]
MPRRERSHPLSAYGSELEGARDVKESVEGLALGGGYVSGSNTSIFDGIPPGAF